MNDNENRHLTDDENREILKNAPKEYTYEPKFQEKRPKNLRLIRTVFIVSGLLLIAVGLAIYFIRKYH